MTSKVVALGLLGLALAWRAEAGVGESLLANAGFEEGTNEMVTGWVAFGKNVRRDAAVARGGLYAGRASGEFNAQPNFAGFMQDFPARAGEQWVVSFWIRQDDTDPLQGKAEAFAKIEFYGADGVFLDALESADRVTSTSPRGSFLHSTVLSVSPPGTKTVRCVAMFAQYDGKSPGSVYFDDGELRRVIKE